MVSMKDAFFRLVCAGLCLSAVTPGLLPTGSRQNPAPASVASAARPSDPAPAPEDPRQWLARQLADVGEDSGWLPALVPPARAPSRVNAVPVPYRPWLPPATTPPAPRLARADGAKPAIRDRPAADLPPLASETVAQLPAPVLLPAVAPPRVPSPDPSTLPLPALAGRGTLDRATLLTDPTPEGTAPPALAVIPPPRKSSPPPLLLTIPDPSGQAPGAAISVARPDDDPPAAAPGTPGRPVLSGKK